MSSILKKTLLAFIGVAILSLGATILKKGNVGLDPFTAMNTGIGDTIGLSLGVYQLLVNFVILIFVFFLDRSFIGIGTVINMVMAGFMIDFFSAQYDQWIDISPNLMGRIIYLIAGVLIFTYGASLYMAVDLGTAPYDAVAPIIVERTKLKYRSVRVVQDVSVVIIAFLFSGPVGIGTVINAFFTGPFISFWNRGNKKLVAKIAESNNSIKSANS